MASTYYTLTDSYVPTASEHLLYMSQATYGKDWKSIPHSHSFTELFYIVDGEGTLLTENGDFPLQANDFVIINPHAKHTEKSSLTHQLNYIVLGVDNLKFQFPDGENLSIYNTAGRSQTILPLLNLMLEELRRKEDFYAEILHSYLAALLLNLRRMAHCDLAAYDSMTIPAECEMIKSYIDSHYQETITLETLAKLAHWDKFYFSHMFVKAFGISPINYLLERRILHSKELLKSTDLNILQVAESTGFSSQNYFSQSFKKYTGETPLQYRKRQKK